MLLNFFKCFHSVEEERVFNHLSYLVSKSEIMRPTKV